MCTVFAYQVANTINIKSLKQQLSGQLLFQDSDELYYQIDEDKFIYFFHYGMVSFFNCSSNEIKQYFERIKPYCQDNLTEKIVEEIEVIVKSNAFQVTFNAVVLPEIDSEMIRLIMLNASQSVALNRYSDISEELLVETNEYTKYLENKGKLNISGIRLKQFIGKVLNIKNKISENLYIFDSPEITWENEQLNKLNLDLKRSFDLKDRYRLIHDRLEIIKENLELFKDIMDHKESSKLEWIIILLILVEVVDMFIAKVFF